jgi:predicted transposase YbfD/YdcC
LGIKNNLHWILDVLFLEEACRKINKNAAQNFSLINKGAINILKNDQSKNIRVIIKRNIASWDLKYLTKALNF